MYRKQHKAFGAVKKIAAVVLTAAVMGTASFSLGSSTSFGVISAEAAATTNYGLAKTSQEGVILHCWNWSYNNIKKYMKDIAAAGYTSIQTSPVQQPKDYYWEGVAYGNVGIPNGTGGEDGNWWKAYQPVTFSICNNGYTWYGNKAEFKAMCAEAEKYGIKVIVDIVANHMGNIQGYKIADKSAPLAERQRAVMDDISPQVGQFWKADMLTDPSYWHISTSWTHSSDGRFDVTQGNMGMPDLNTGDKKVQNMVLGLLKECIDCGADGFRFDAAKHIETPADSASFASEFWNVVLDGARAYYKQVNGYDGVYFYGEVLNRLDDTNAENYYLSKMSLTDNSTSDNLRNSVVNGQVSALATSNYCGYIHGKANHAVLWAESHDTYMGGGSSYDATDADIKKTWAIMASRKDSTALFFARPYYSKDILAGDVSKARQSSAVIMENIGGEQTQLGDVGTLTWADPEVVAVNRFRNFFVGQSERLGATGNTAYNVRGTTGIVIVRGEGPGTVSISAGMKDGTYTDQVSGEKFTVSGGRISGKITNKNGIAVIYNPTVNYGKVTPEKPVKLLLKAGTADGKTIFTTDHVSVRMEAEGAVSTKYTTSEGQSGSFTGTSKTITVGDYTSTGDTVSVTMTATGSDGISKQKTFSFTKKVITSEYPTLSKGGVVFDNSGYGWKDVYCYAYMNDGAVKNAAWPGVKMSQDVGDYFSYEFPSTLSGTVYVIFNNNAGVQYPSGAGLTMASTAKKLFTNNALTALPASRPALKVSYKLSGSELAVGQPVTITATAANASGTVKYAFLCNDGTTIRAAGTSNTCTWTPTKAGKVIIAVKAQDSSYSMTTAGSFTVQKQSNKLIANGSLTASGNTITLKGSATGGTAPYQYTYCYKPVSATSWTSVKGYSSATSVSFDVKTAGDYDACVKVKDAAGTVAKAYFNFTIAPSTPTLKINLSASSITLGKTVKVTAVGSGGTAPYEYAVFYKRASASSWTTKQKFRVNNTVTIKPLHTGTYQICVKVKDQSGSITKLYKNVTVKEAPLSCTLKVSSDNLVLGKNLTATVTASGGKTPYQYAVFYKRASSSTWTTAQKFRENNVVSFKPQNTGTYNICVKVKDAAGTIVKAYTDITVIKPPLSGSATLSAGSIQKGKSVTITAKGTGGTSPYKFSFFYRKTADSKWTNLQSAKTNSSLIFTPAAVGTYDICVYVIDSTGTISKLYMTLKVTA